MKNFLIFFPNNRRIKEAFRMLIKKRKLRILENVFEQKLLGRSYKET